MNDLTFSLNRALSLASKLNESVEAVPNEQMREMIEDMHHELCRAKFKLSGVMGEQNSLRKRLQRDSNQNGRDSGPVLFNGCIDM